MPPLPDRAQHRRRAGVRAGGVLAAVCSFALAAAACGAPSSSGGGTPQPASSIPDKPSSPVTINVLDVAGNLQLSQGMLDDFTKAHSDIISKVTTSKATAPELAGKIKAQQNAGRVDIDLVLTGTDGLAAGIEQGLWIELLPKYADKFGNLEGRGEDAEARGEQGHHRRLLPVGTAPRVHARQV